MLYFRDETIEIAGKADIFLNAGNHLLFVWKMEKKRKKKNSNEH